MIDWARWMRQFPFTVDVQRCEDCGGVMETEFVHDKHSQEHWRGVEAYVCEDCGRTERTADT